MSKKKKNIYNLLTDEEFSKKLNNYMSTISTDSQYSTLVDPDGLYNFNEKEKSFIGLYCEFKNIEYAAMLSGLDLTEAMKLYSSYSCQQEIRRINLALYQKQFTTKLLTITEIGGWLSSLLLDQVPVADRLKSNEKIGVASKLIEINQLLQESTKRPGDIIDTDVEELKEKLKDLSVDSLKLLLDKTNKKEDKEEKEKLINLLQNKNKVKFTQEEISFMLTLSVDELNNLLEKINKKEEINNEEINKSI